MKLDDSYLARRRFLGGLLGSGVAALGAGAAVPLVQYVGNFHAEPPPDRLELTAADYQLPPGTAKTRAASPAPATAAISTSMVACSPARRRCRCDNSTTDFGTAN